MQALNINVYEYYRNTSRHGVLIKRSTHTGHDIVLPKTKQENVPKFD